MAQTDPARVLAALRKNRLRHQVRKSGITPAIQDWQQEMFGRTMGAALPRDPAEFLQGTFTPLTPIQPVAINVPEGNDDRPGPRQREMPPGWNMPVGQPGTEGFKLASFQTLRTYADIYSVARACIQVRKGEIRGMAWDIMPTEEAEKKMRGDQAAHRDFNERKREVVKFFRRPDPDYLSHGSYIDAVLEEMLVTDALSLYLHPTQKKGGYGPFGKDVAALEVISGSTIRPLVNVRGGRVRPPNPGYQQYLYGVPRVDLMELLQGSDDEAVKDLGKPAKEYRGDQLLYLPYTQRAWTPYGFPPLERTLIPTITGLRKQQFQLDYFDEGTIPGTYISPGESLGWTPNQLQIWQDQQNAIAGDPAWKHKAIALPPGSKVFPQRPVPLADQFDEIVMSQVCMGYDVMPMEMGISPKVSTTQSPGAANQMAKATEKTNERKTLKPTLSFLTDIFNLLIQEVWGQQDMRFVYEGLEEDEDENALVERLVQMIQYGLLSVDECRIALKRAPWGLPITSDPVYVNPTAGMVPLGSIDPTTGKPIAAAPPAAIGAPPPPGGAAPGGPPGVGGPPKPPGAVPGAPKPPGALPGGAPGHTAPSPGGPGQPPVAPAGPHDPHADIHPDDKVGQARQEMAERHADLQNQLHEDFASGKPMEPPVRPPISASTEDADHKDPPPAKSKPSTKAIIAELQSLTRHLNKGRDVGSWECRAMPPEILDYHTSLLKHMRPEDAAAVTTDFVVLCFGPSTLVAQLDDATKTFTTAAPMNSQDGAQGLAPMPPPGASRCDCCKSSPCTCKSGAGCCSCNGQSDNGATADLGPNGVTKGVDTESKPWFDGNMVAPGVTKVGPHGYEHGWVKVGADDSGYGVFSHPVNTDMQMAHGSSVMESNDQYRNTPGYFPQRFSVADLHPTQHKDPDEMAQGEGTPGLPLVVTSGGNHYLIDGHHRAAAAGPDGSIVAYHVNTDPPPKPKKRARKAAEPGPKAPARGRATRDWPGWKYDIQLAALYADELERSLAAAVDPADLARAWLAAVPGLAPGKAVLGPLAQLAWSWLQSRGFAKPIRGAIQRVLTDLWTEGFAVGQEAGKEMLDSAYGSSFWSKWKPGDPAAARLTAGPGLQKLLQDYGIQTIQSVAQTKLHQLANVLADGFTKGNTPDELARAIEPVLKAPERAQMIAVTELARATTQAAVEQYKLAGMEGKRWSVTGNPPDNRVCETRCKPNGEAGAIAMSQPFPSGDEFAPAHPHCRCAILPEELPADTSATPGIVTKSKGFVAGGLAVRAADTGRVLMIQRAHDEDDPAGGLWEFPGGRLDPGESVGEAAKREWMEETGLPLPQGYIHGVWDQGDYRGHVMSVASEDACPILDREKGANPDDPAAKHPEAIAWWDPAELRDNPAIRPELQKHPKRVRRALESTGQKVGKSAEMTADEYNAMRDVIGRLPGLQKAIGHKVYDQLARNYPPESIAWVRRATWEGPKLVPWAEVDHDDMDKWAASHEPERVKHFEEKIRRGDHPNPVVLVADPDGNYINVDGHHRALAYRNLGRPVLAWIGRIDPADRKAMEETHLDQVHEGAHPLNKLARPQTLKVGPKGYIHGWIYVGPGECHDGCGTKTKGGKYAPGHDAKHVKQLAEAVKAGHITHEQAHAALDHSEKLQGKLASKLGVAPPAHGAAPNEAAAHPAPGEAPQSKITAKTGTTPDGREWTARITPAGVGSVYHITANPKPTAGALRDLELRVTYVGSGQVKVEHATLGFDGQTKTWNEDVSGLHTLDSLKNRTKVYQVAAEHLVPAQKAEQAAKPKAPPKPAPAPVVVGKHNLLPWNGKDKSHEQVKAILDSEELPGKPYSANSASEHKAYVASRIADRINATAPEMIAAMFPPGWTDTNQKDSLTAAAAHPEDYVYSVGNGGSLTVIKRTPGTPAEAPQLTEKTLKEYAASKLIQTWAGTSNDSNVRSLAIQHAAEEEFGLENVAPWAAQTGQLAENVKQATEQHGAAYRAFLRAQYDLTQEDLKERGLTHVNVVRGMAWQNYGAALPSWTHGVKSNQTIPTPPLRPLSSWTVNAGTATSFASSGSYKVVLKASIPASSILSWPRSGFGCLNEYEIVAFSGLGQVKVSSAKLPDAPIEVVS